MAMHSRHVRASWLSVPALAGAMAALVLPGATSTTAAGAALLAVGALALLAGHPWGLMVSVPSHVTVAGQVFPALTAAGTSFSSAAIWIVLVTALPAVALATVVVPAMSRDLLGERRPARAHAAFVALTSGALLAALIVPAL